MKVPKNLSIRSVILIFIVTSCSPKFSKEINVKLEGAGVTVSGNRITASTGEATRCWKLTMAGLNTVEFNSPGGPEVIGYKNQFCDWNFRWMTSGKPVKLVAVKVEKDNDEGFAGDFIRTRLEFQYPVSGIGLLYDIWTIPGAPGFRTQISLKKSIGTDPVPEFTEGKVEQLQLDPSFRTVRAVGYFNDTQHRNKTETPVLKEEDFPLKKLLDINWANVLMALNNEGGLILVKESHKCVNQPGVNTGDFKISPSGIAVSGAGLDSAHLSVKYQPCWATWSIVYKGDRDQAGLALRQFDRNRYPIDPTRDVYIMSNTWGSEDSGANSKYASREENILREIETANELGIDLLQIDDGWQGTDYKNWKPVRKAVYFNNREGSGKIIPNGAEYSVYPGGWVNVRQAAQEKGIDLGLWAAWTIPYEDLVWNFKQGGFRTFKLDFSNLKTYDILHEFENRVRKFILETGHKVRVNWDVTENAARIGYFFGREYGNIYLENRKPEFPENVIYHPSLVLRDAWHVSKYTNLNKFQITYQNPDRVDREASDAYLHGHDYCLAITLMGSPIFFQEVHLLSQNARQILKPLIETYKSVRDEMYKGYVLPIGNEPDNNSWTGFQNYNPETYGGYLTIFRELNNPDNKKSFSLKFASGKKVFFENLLSGETFEAPDGADCLFTLTDPGKFLFLNYQIK